MKDYATSLNCIDGRVQRKVTDYLTATFGARYVDTITAPGIVKHLATTTERSPRILGDLAISFDRHRSTQIGVAAHADCAGNPVRDSIQRDQMAHAMIRLGELHPEAEVVGLWVDKHQIVTRIRAG